MFSFKTMSMTAALVTAGLLTTSSPASAQCGRVQGSAGSAYSAPYAGGGQVYRYRSGYQSGASPVVTGGYGYSGRAYAAPGFIGEQSAYRRSLGKPF